MQYLARVQNNSASGIDLQLLARHDLLENTWIVDGVWRSVHLADDRLPATFTPRVGFLVLVELDEEDFPKAIEDINDRLSALVQPKDPTSEDYRERWAQEQEQIEIWRQELTLKSQELTIRNLELESSREKMETSFSTKQEELDRREEELDRREKELGG